MTSKVCVHPRTSEQPVHPHTSEQRVHPHTSEEPVHPCTSEQPVQPRWQQPSSLVQNGEESALNRIWMPGLGEAE